MTDAIDFLEQLGRNARLRHAPATELERVLAASGFEPSLRSALLAYSPRFVETLTERLMTFALGRGVKYYDMPAVRQIKTAAAAKNNRFSALVLGIVESPAFQRNQVATELVATH